MKDENNEPNPYQNILFILTNDTLDYYNELIWLLHSLDPNNREYKDNELFRKRISEKYAKIIADYNILLEKELIDMPNKNVIECKIAEHMNYILSKFDNKI